MGKRIAVLMATLLVMVSLLGMSFAENAYFDSSVYKKGDDSTDVRLIQMALFLDGTYSGEEYTTAFGPKTEAAVKAFQKKYQLTADGIVGQGTMDKLIALGLMPFLSETSYRVEDEGNDVRFIQLALIEEGFLNLSRPTTTFGSMTEAAVKSFQKEYDLTADGIVGNATISKMADLGYLKLANQGSVTEENSSDYEAEVGIEENSVSESVGEVSRVTFKLGDSDEDVTVLQTALSALGYLDTAKITGTFDANTEAAVMAYQAAHNLTADGIVGSGTFSTLRNQGVITYKTAAVASRGTTGRYGEYLDWFEEVLPMAQAIYGADYRGKIKIVIEDYYTGVQINALFSYGHNHMDIEPLTAEDTEKIKKLWDYNYSWTMRPVLVYYLDHVVAASLAGMPHAGSTLNRISDNGMYGVLDLHFKNSRTHATNKVDNRHQVQVKIAAGVE